MPDLGALSAMSDAVESGLGLPEVVRAAARALDASLVLIDRSSSVLAVAARSTADERTLMRDAEGVETHELRVGDAVVGRLRLRPRGGPPSAAVLRVATTMIASEVERLRAPDRASEAAQAAFLVALFERKVTDRGDILARASELGADLSEGGAVVVVRAHHFAPADEDWRARVLAAAERAARAGAPGSLAAVLDSAADPTGHVVVLLPTAGDAGLRRVVEGIARELHASVHGFTFALGHSRVAQDPVDLYRAGNEALLAANVAIADTDDEVAALAFEDTGAYRLLLPAMSEDPAELQRFYEETVAPLVAYDDQYETELVQTLETFLDADGNVAGTAARLFTHRHTVRYRLERVKDLTTLDVSSTDGREKLGLGLKAMRVLGIAAPRGPATEAGAGGGRVKRETKDR
jgi:sugar diacid utilization regulator